MLITELQLGSITITFSISYTSRTLVCCAHPWINGITVYAFAQKLIVNGMDQSIWTKTCFPACLDHLLSPSSDDLTKFNNLLKLDLL